MGGRSLGFHFPNESVHGPFPGFFEWREKKKKNRFPEAIDGCHLSRGAAIRLKEIAPRNIIFPLRLERWAKKFVRRLF